MLAKFIIVVTGMALAAPLAAETPSSDKSSQIVVTYYDLDLTRKADLAVLDGRIRRAAERLCPYRNDRIDLSRQRIAAKCVAASTARTSASVAQAVQMAEVRKARGQLAAR